jgi:predicted  nucleic acid-binding Zn-ribbon protein
MSEYCKYCGEKYSDAKSLLLNSCSHHPSGFRKGRHALFEGDKNGIAD